MQGMAGNKICKFVQCNECIYHSLHPKCSRADSAGVARINGRLLLRTGIYLAMGPIHCGEAATLRNCNVPP